MKKLCVLVIGCTFCLMSAFGNDDPMDFDNFAIVDSTDADVTMDSVELNSDASVANVSAFDIAGIMLGMPFEDVQTLFFKTKGLYTPRKNNSLIYTIHKDWKCNR